MTALVVVDAQREGAALADLAADRHDPRSRRIVAQAAPRLRLGGQGVVDEAAFTRDEREVGARRFAVGAGPVADDALDDDVARRVLACERRTARIAEAGRAA